MRKGSSGCCAGFGANKEEEDKKEETMMRKRRSLQNKATINNWHFQHFFDCSAVVTRTNIS